MYHILKLPLIKRERERDEVSTNFWPLPKSLTFHVGSSSSCTTTTYLECSKKEKNIYNKELLDYGEKSTDNEDQALYSYCPLKLALLSMFLDFFLTFFKDFNPLC